MSISTLDDAPAVAKTKIVHPDPVLIAEGLSVGYGKTVILKDVSIAVPRGQMTAIVGVTGGGKSTLLQTLGLLARPLASGRFDYIAAPDSSPLPLATLRQGQRNHLIRSDFAYVFQRVELVNHWDARSNISLPLLSRGVPQPVIDETVRELWDCMHFIRPMDGRPVAQLSGGERQRVGIARALAMQPTVVFADEPFGSLDPHTANDVMEHFFRVLGERAITGVLVTHDLEAAWNHCQQEYQIHETSLERTR